jgi:coronin-1B/1C/6
MSAALKTENLDTSSGLLMPHYDADTQLLFLSGRGDGNIRYYEIVDEAPYAHFVAEYKSTEPQRAVTFLPKRAVSVSENEIARAYKVHTTGLVEPVSFRVPRKGEGFQSDIFPETPGPTPALSASAFFDERRTAEPVLISLAAGFAPALRRDFTVSLDGLDSQSRSASGLLSSVGGGNGQEEELVRLRAENAQLRAEVEALKARLQ